MIITMVVVVAVPAEIMFYHLLLGQSIKCRILNSILCCNTVQFLHMHTENVM